MSHAPSVTAPKQRGIALFEVLISLVVISIGLLGLAALQVSSMQNTQTTRFYEAASYGLKQLQERLSSNSASAAAKEYDFNNLKSADQSKKPKDGCSDTDKTAKCIARRDLDAWYEQLTKEIPSPRVSITTTDQASGVKITALVVWDASLAGKSGEDYPECNQTTRQKVDSYQCNQIVLWLAK